MKWLQQLFGAKARLVVMSEDTERQIISEMMKIERIDDYWELQKQCGYQLFAKTKDERYLGYAEMATTMLTLFNQMRQPQEENKTVSRGYQSSIE